MYSRPQRGRETFLLGSVVQAIRLNIEHWVASRKYVCNVSKVGASTVRFVEGKDNLGTKHVLHDMCKLGLKASVWVWREQQEKNKAHSKCPLVAELGDGIRHTDLDLAA